MYICDYHLHSINSPDGFDPIDLMCEYAIKNGVAEIAITDHYDVTSNKAYYNEFNFDKIKAEVFAAREKYAGKLKVMLGMEIGQPQADGAEAKRFLKNNSVDFIIGSIHNLKNDSDVFFYDYNKISCDMVFDKYLDEVIEMARDFDYDVIGHITYPLRYMFNCGGRTVDLTNFEGKLKCLFKILVERKKGIEINTSGIFSEMAQTLPPLYVVKLFKECGGEFVTIGSDSHKAHLVGTGIKEGQEMLRQAGFGHFTTYENRVPKLIKI